jgi:hypothetical protein
METCLNRIAEDTRPIGVMIQAGLDTSDRIVTMSPEGVIWFPFTLGVFPFLLIN